MTSEKKLLKENMRAVLEQRHTKFLATALGAEHPATSLQQVRTAKALVARELECTRVDTASLLELTLTEAKEIRRQTQVVRELQRLRLDDVVDSLTELRDSVQELREDVLTPITEALRRDGDESPS
ncbi:T96 [Tupaiid betaherpesvirus 1]|uniref:T96 n=1 Tax=Tupaiid herpesvirus 1 (strain 1) TaxID=10397 RepID=Q91TK8_TUHV1|nr:T96 [Tupaiid betaherpesvirus 1]AAK57139.1 T96 [Tupaiid betaherpesvirus 1]